jgi:hypothetical protein
MRSLNTLILESACMIANEIQAKALLVYADVIQDYPIPSGMLEQTDVILVSQLASPAEPSAEITFVLHLPPIPLTRVAQVKLAVVMGLAAGYVAAGDKIVCLTGIPDFGSLDCIFVLDIHLFAALLHIAQVIDDQCREAIQPLQFFLQPESRFGQKQPLDQQYAGSEINGVTLLDQFMAQGAQKMRFPATGIPENENILSSIQKVTVQQDRELARDTLFQATAIKSRECLFAGQPRCQQQLPDASAGALL